MSIDEIISAVTNSGEFSQEEPISHDSYRIGDLQADSVILTHQKGGNTHATLYVNSVIYGHAFTIVYDNLASAFDQDLPTVNKLIDSITIGAGL